MAKAAEAAADLASPSPGTAPQRQQPLQPGEASTGAGSQAASDRVTLMRRLLRLDHFQPELAISVIITALRTAHHCSRHRAEREMSLHQLLSRLCWDPNTAVCSVVRQRLSVHGQPRLSMKRPLGSEHASTGMKNIILLEPVLARIDFVWEYLADACERASEPAVDSHQLFATARRTAVALLGDRSRELLEQASDDVAVVRRIEAINDCLDAQACPGHQQERDACPRGHTCSAASWYGAVQHCAGGCNSGCGGGRCGRARAGSSQGNRGKCCRVRSAK